MPTICRKHLLHFENTVNKQHENLSRLAECVTFNTAAIWVNILFSTFLFCSCFQGDGKDLFK